MTDHFLKEFSNNDDTVFGRYIFTNGYVYEGQMKNHKMHGKGKIFNDSRLIYEGLFENGEQIGDKIFMTHSTDDSEKIMAKPIKGIAFASSNNVREFEKDDE